MNWPIFASTSNKNARWGVPDSGQWQRKLWGDQSLCGSKGDRDANKWTKAKPRARLNYPRPLFGRALGSPRFRAMAEKNLGQSVIVRQQGRPRRQQVEES